MLSSLGLDYSLRKQENPGKKCKKPAFRVSLFGEDAEILLSKIPLASRHNKKEFLSRENKNKEVKSVKILEINKIESSEPVYDLEVEGNHTFISGQGLFIHSNCRTRLDSKYAGPWGTLRTGNDIYITLNLPRIAYESRGNDEKFFELLDKRMAKMADILLIKHKITDDLLHNQWLLKFLSQKMGEEEYYNVMNTTKTLGYAGLTEAVKYHTGNHLHESPDAQKFGLKVIGRMREFANECSKTYGLRFSVIASPAETCAARLSKLDIAKFGRNVIFSGSKEAPYYTNSHMVKMDANIPMSEKIKIEENYHPLTNGGHILHLWLGEQSPSAESLLELSKKICRTNIGFYGYTKDYSVCNPCSNFQYGLKQKCGNCDSEDLSRYSRITGYYQRVEGWNPSKKQELKDRYRYQAPECNCD
jgi:ribonucleoside-triphosphate reductase